jgi:hypothetical protein
MKVRHPKKRLCMYVCCMYTTGIIQTSQAFFVCTDTDYNVQLYTAHSPCWLPFAPPSTPFYLLGTLLAVTGSVHLGLRLLVNWPPLSQSFPQTLPPPNSQNPSYPAPHWDDLRKNPASSVRNNTVYFSPLKAKNKPCEEVMNVRLFLSLLAWLPTATAEMR